MTSGEFENWPGRATDPAFSLAGPPYDGGLRRRWRFTLTQADALAWCRLTHPVSRRSRNGLGVICFLIGAGVALMPPALVGPWGSASFVATLLVPVLLVLFTGWALRESRLRRLSQALVPMPRPGLFEDWGDSLAVTTPDGDGEDFVALEMIATLRLTRRHLIITSPSGVLLVPLSAFVPGEVAEIAHDLARRRALDVTAARH